MRLPSGMRTTAWPSCVCSVERRRSQPLLPAGRKRMDTMIIPASNPVSGKRATSQPSNCPEEGLSGARTPAGCRPPAATQSVRLACRARPQTPSQSVVGRIRARRRRERGRAHCPRPRSRTAALGRGHAAGSRSARLPAERILRARALRATRAGHGRGGRDRACALASSGAKPSSSRPPSSRGCQRCATKHSSPAGDAAEQPGRGAQANAGVEPGALGSGHQKAVDAIPSGLKRRACSSGFRFSRDEEHRGAPPVAVGRDKGPRRVGAQIAALGIDNEKSRRFPGKPPACAARRRCRGLSGSGKNASCGQVRRFLAQLALDLVAQVMEINRYFADAGLGEAATDVRSRGQR